jgi:hypothetical protein
MPQPTASPAISRERKAIIEKLLGEGWDVPGHAGGRGAVIGEAALQLKLNRATLESWLRTQKKRAGKGQENYLPDWTRFRPFATPSRGTIAAPRPAPGVRRYILTAAQDETPIHAAFWANLQAFAAWYEAQIIVGGFTYQKGLFEDHATRTAVFASAVQPFLSHQRVDLGGVVFCAEMNILPTATRPLQGLESYSAGQWAVFPHAKVQLVSVPTISSNGATILMTTGACTLPNYVAKKAGLKAEFHHVVGATLVEIDAAGRTFCRQLNATDDGGFQDLDVRVSEGRITTGARIEAITYGDIHREKLDPLVAMGTWGFDLETETTVTAENLLDALRPRHQIYHDLLDFTTRNHHNRGDHQFRFRMLCRGTDSVEDAMRSTARFVRVTARDFCTSVVAPSNHNDAYPRWLREADFRQDPANALFWLRSTTAVYESIARDEPDFDVFRWALTALDPEGMAEVVFPPRNGSYVICQASGGIECAIHGDLGPNGARGTPNNLTRVATKMNTGHTHSAGILDGVYTAGLSGLMDQDYNRGPSSWSQSHILTYPSGKRTILTMRDGRWRA